MKQIFLFTTLILLSLSSFAQTTLVSYDFTGAAGNQATQATASVGANITATAISRSTSATGAAISDGMGSNNWPSGNNLDLNTYFEFSVTPVGIVLTLDELIFAEQSINNGARNFAIRTSIDNFATDVFTSENFTTGTRERIINMSSITSSNTITIRIYGYRPVGNGNIWGLKNNSVSSNMRLTGTASIITYVYDNGWTPANPEGVSEIINPIEIVAGDYTFGADVSCESITVAPGSTMTVSNVALIDAVNGINLQSVSNSYSGLILNGAIDGTIRYSRYVNAIGSGTTGGNDLVTPPLDGQRFDNFANANSGILAASGTLRAWAPFNNATSAYENYDILTDRFINLKSGLGFRAATVSGGGNLLFTGTANTSNIDATITVEPGTFGQWNAIGNPYPSYIDIDAFLNHSVSGLTNSEKLALDAQAIYGYDGSATDGWEIINLSNAAGRLMAPGQGFFVAADNANFLRFTPAMRTPGNGDDFIPGRSATALTFLKLKATNGSQNYTTDIYFNDNASLGFDPGYDAKIWGGDTSGFKLYSHVVENNTGIALALQSLNTNSLSGVVIPLGINSGAGTTLTFSLQDFNLPGTVQVYLEDAANNTITRIDNNNHSVTLNQPVNGTGRFFLRLTDSTLGLDDQTSSSINIYHQAADEVIVIAGALLSNTPAYLYDLQGRVVSATNLNAAQLEQRIDVSGLSTGIYVVSFDNGEKRITKKLIIK